jgi:hypothetical protein
MAGKEFDWNQFPVAEAKPQGGGFDWNQFEPVKPSEPAAPEITKTQSAARGAAQGVSFGFADEITGGVEALWNKANGDPTEFGKLYAKARDESRANFDAAQKANPKSYLAGEVGGAVATAFVPGLNLAKGASLAKVAGQAALMGGAAGAGYSTAEDAAGVVKDTVKGAALGAGVGAGAHIAAPYVGKLATKAGNKLKGFAEKAAVNATGATGKQAANFSDDAGRQLLDRKIVRFGDSQEKIAARAADAVEEANKQIDGALTALEEKGVAVDANEIYKVGRETINKMKSDPSKADIAKMLEGELDNLFNATEARGSTRFPVKEAEAIKRGYSRKAGNWADPEKGMVGKEMYQTWRHGVEDAAKQADPGIAATFEKGKKTYGLMAPIEEAAQRRASTTAQSPAVGLLDVSTGVAGAAGGGIGGMVLAPIARRLIAPRAASTIAVAADKAGNAISRAGGAVQRAATNSPGAVSGAGRQLLRPESKLRTPKVSEEESPKNGPKKWAADGLAKLNQHSPDSPLPKDILEDPKKRDILIMASDLKPGSKAMQQLLERIRK